MRNFERETLYMLLRSNLLLLNSMFVVLSRIDGDITESGFFDTLKREDGALRDFLGQLENELFPPQSILRPQEGAVDDA